MPSLKSIIANNIYRPLWEADEAPVEDVADDDFDLDLEDETKSVEGADEANDDAGMEEEADEESIIDDEMNDATITTPENFEDLDKTIEGMVGVTEIQHTTSSTILDFEDGGQLMFVHPMVSIQSDTLNKIIGLIIDDVNSTYATQKDEITGKQLSQTKYWASISTLVSTMVRSQLTKSDNIDGLIDEIKQVFKVLEVK